MAANYEDEQLQGGGGDGGVLVAEEEDDHTADEQAGDSERLLRHQCRQETPSRAQQHSSTDLRAHPPYNPGAPVWEDSPEFAVSKTILELARLTLHSLRVRHDDADERVSPLRTQDSILSMAGGGRHHREATVAAILPYAPVLRHRHVAVRISLSLSCLLAAGHDRYVWQ